MPRPHLFIRLTNQQESELLNFIRESSREQPPNLRARQRGQVILLSHQGKTIKQISKAYNLSTRSIRSWFKTYQNKGLKGLTGPIKGLTLTRRKREIMEEPLRKGRETGQADYPIMTLAQTAQYLQVSHPTIYRLVQNNKLPAIKLGKQWRFRKEDVYNYLSRICFARMNKKTKQMLAKKTKQRR